MRQAMLNPFSFERIDNKPFIAHKFNLQQFLVMDKVKNIYRKNLITILDILLNEYSLTFQEAFHSIIQSRL